MNIIYVLILLMGSLSLSAQNDCDKLKTEYAKLTETLDKKLIELESFKQKNKEIEDLISLQQKAIEEHKVQIAKMLTDGNAAQENLLLAKKAIEQYESIVEALQVKLEELVKANEALSKENKRLKKQ